MSDVGAAISGTKPADMRSIPGTKPRGLSRVTNGAKLLEGLDGRTRRARRMRDVMDGLVADYRLETETEFNAAVEAASLTIWIQDQAAALASGKRVSARQMAVVEKLLRGLREDFAEIRRRRARPGAAA